MNLSHKIVALADAIAEAGIIELHSGDREPGRQLSTEGKKWVVDALRFYALQPPSNDAPGD